MNRREEEDGIEWEADDLAPRRRGRARLAAILKLVLIALLVISLVLSDGARRVLTPGGSAVSPDSYRR